MSDIDAALKNIKDQMNDFSSNHAGVILDEDCHRDEIETIIEALTTLRDLKQELKENGDMPNTIWAKKDDLSCALPSIMGIDLSEVAIEFTRTVPTLKKILGDL